MVIITILQLMKKTFTLNAMVIQVKDAFNQALECAFHKATYKTLAFKVSQPEFSLFQITVSQEQMIIILRLVVMTSFVDD